MTTNKLGLYVHIPFCVKKCNYCDFCSVGGASEGEMGAYVEALCREIESYREGEEEGVDINKHYVDSIFFGGGTPSLLAPALISRILDSLRDHFCMAEKVEITIEANPGTLNLEKLSAYRSMGINRLSMGVQSMDHDMLHFLGRIHDQETVLANYQQARRAGFDNINLDLMFGIPGQSFSVWEDTLQEVLALSPEHLSFYSLQIEEGTPFYRWFVSGKLAQLPEELDRRMYHATLEQLSKKGYLHYEISNAAKPGFLCRHNMKYWTMEDYLGLGLSAHSYVEGVRFFNPSDMEQYQKGNLPQEVSRNSRIDSISDQLFTGLRLISGIDLQAFERRYAQSIDSMFPGRIEKFIEDGLLEMDGCHLKFSKRGLDFTNTVLRELMQVGG